jgi:hypothetical protein
MGRYEFNQQKQEINIPEIIKEIKSISFISSDILILFVGLGGIPYMVLGIGAGVLF